MITRLILITELRVSLWFVFFPHTGVAVMEDNNSKSPREDDCGGDGEEEEDQEQVITDEKDSSSSSSSRFCIEEIPVPKIG